MGKYMKDALPNATFIGFIRTSINMDDKSMVEDLIRKNSTVEWDKKESARAYMRTKIKRLLRKYQYPPEQAKGAVGYSN